MPAVLEISTAIGCAVRCAFCPQTVIEAAYHGPRLMTLDLFRRCLSHAPVAVPLIFAGFAEPFLNNATADMMEASGGHEITIYTTGVGVGPRDIEAMQRVRPKEVTLHLADAEGYATIRCDERYVATVTAIADTLPDVRWMTMGTLHPALVPRFGNVPAHPMHSRAGNVKGMVRLSKAGPLRCGAAPELDHPVLLPDGTLALCCMSYELGHNLGNLAESTWQEIRDGQGLAEIRRLMRDGDCLCRSCEYACNSEVPASSPILAYDESRDSLRERLS